MAIVLGISLKLGTFQRPPTHTHIPKAPSSKPWWTWGTFAGTLVNGRDALANVALQTSPAFAKLRIKACTCFRSPVWIKGWQRVAAQKEGIENALFNLKKRWSKPGKALKIDGFSGIFHAFSWHYFHENCTKNAWKCLKALVKKRVFSVFFQIPSLAPPLCHSRIEPVWVITHIYISFFFEPREPAWPPRLRRLPQQVFFVPQPAGHAAHEESSDCVNRGSHYHWKR